MIDIIISTYNGGLFIEQQIESLLSQSYNNFKVFIRDDGSKDNTKDIINKNVDKYSNKFILIKNNEENVGCSKSFMQMLGLTESKYIMFCDQDDIWLPDKIEISLNAIMELEKKNPGKPAMVFTDLKVVDSDLNLIDESFWHFQKINPAIALDWKKTFAQSVVTGCTMIMNSKVKDVVLPFAVPEMLHDHWITINVAKHGVVSYLPKQTVMYRQHGKNVLGALSFSPRYIFNRLKHFKRLFITYKKAVKYFGEITLLELAILKFKITFDRLIK